MVGKNFSALAFFILIPARFDLAAADLGILVDFESLFEMHILDESSYVRPEVESDMMNGDRISSEPVSTSVGVPVHSICFAVALFISRLALSQR